METAEVEPKDEEALRSLTQDVNNLVAAAGNSLLAEVEVKGDCNSGSEFADLVDKIVRCQKYCLELVIKTSLSLEQVVKGNNWRPLDKPVFAPSLDILQLTDSEGVGNLANVGSQHSPESPAFAASTIPRLPQQVECGDSIVRAVACLPVGHATSASGLQVKKRRKMAVNQPDNANIRVRWEDDHLQTVSPTGEVWNWRKYGRKELKKGTLLKHYHRCKEKFTLHCEAKLETIHDPHDDEKLEVVVRGEHNHDPWTVASAAASPVAGGPGNAAVTVAHGACSIPALNATGESQLLAAPLCATAAQPVPPQSAQTMVQEHWDIGAGPVVKSLQMDAVRIPGQVSTAAEDLVSTDEERNMEEGIVSHGARGASGSGHNYNDENMVGWSWIQEDPFGSEDTPWLQFFGYEEEEYVSHRAEGASRFVHDGYDFDDLLLETPWLQTLGMRRKLLLATVPLHLSSPPYHHGTIDKLIT